MSESISSATVKARRHARAYGVQALYQWQVAEPTIEDLLVQFMSQPAFARADADYFQEVVRGVVQNVAQIDEMIQRYIDRELSALNPVELAVLRLSFFELMFRLDIPYRVVLNEGIELVKKYGSVEGHKYVNAVLDRATKDLREIERS